MIALGYGPKQGSTGGALGSSEEDLERWNAKDKRMADRVGGDDPKLLSDSEATKEALPTANLGRKIDTKAVCASWLYVA